MSERPLPLPCQRTNTLRNARKQAHESAKVSSKRRPLKGEPSGEAFYGHRWPPQGEGCVWKKLQRLVKLCVVCKCKKDHRFFSRRREEVVQMTNCSGEQTPLELGVKLLLNPTKFAGQTCFREGHLLPSYHCSSTPRRNH